VTTLVGIQGRSWALLGADTRVTSEGTIYRMPKGHSKIIDVDGIFIATAGDVRGCNILEHGLKIPKVTAKSDEHFITSFFIPAIRQAFADAGYEKTSDGVSSHETEFLVAYNGRIYEIDSDYSWVQDARNIYALGSGGMIALGALATLVGDSITKTEARKWALKALDVASQYNADTAPPYHVVIQDN
jgi:20S proteasome alpha/beta subunit